MARPGRVTGLPHGEAMIVRREGAHYVRFQ